MPAHTPASSRSKLRVKFDDGVQPPASLDGRTHSLHFLSEFTTPTLNEQFCPCEGEQLREINFLLNIRGIKHIITLDFLVSLFHLSLISCLKGRSCY